MPRNIEIKARIDSVKALLPRARALADDEPVTTLQEDTFFAVTHGRLKLRRYTGGTAELIHYHRPDTAEAKASDYLRVMRSLSLASAPRLAVSYLDLPLR